MGRARLTMDLIPNKKSRNTTFQKRKNGLKKKMYEFSTLCGVDACMILYGPYHEDRPMELDTWPSDPVELRRIIDRYKNAADGKRSLGLADFFEAQTKKIESEIAKVRRSNAKAKYAPWDDRIDHFSLDQLGELLFSVDNKLQTVKARIDLAKESRRSTMMEEVASQGMIGCSHTQSSQSNSYNYSQDLFQSQCPSSVKPLDYYMPSNYSSDHSSMKPLDYYMPSNYSSDHSSVKPLDYYLPSNYSSDQMGPHQMAHFDQNPKAGSSMMMLLMDDHECSTEFGSTSNNNIVYTQSQPPLYFDPMSGMLDNTRYNNPTASTSSYNRSMQPLQPYVQHPVMGSASQVQGSQVNNYYDFNDFKVMNKRPRY